MRNRKAKTFIAFFWTLLILPSVAQAKKKSLASMPLQWTPTSEFSELGVIDLTGVGNLSIQVSDLEEERSETGRIGENREDEPKVLPVGTSSDVPAFIAEGVRKTFDRIGLRVSATDADLILSGAVRRFFVTERNAYEGELVLWITAKTPDGKVLWEGLVSGSASRFGRSYKAENYNEVFSDSIMDATVSLLQNATFLEAMRRASNGG